MIVNIECQGSNVDKILLQQFTKRHTSPNQIYK